MNPLSTQPLPLPRGLRSGPITDQESEALWAMTPAQRADAMWRDALSLPQLCQWSSRRPAEVPLLGREYAWIIKHTPEWDEAAEQHANNVIDLPIERRLHAAA